MITINAVQVRDHLPLIESLLQCGLSSAEANNLNSFVYGCLPEGSYGSFLVSSKDLSDSGIASGVPVTLTITGVTNTFTHVFLHVVKIQHFDISLTGWTYAENTHVSIVYLSDITHVMDNAIKADFNVSAEDGSVGLDSFSILIDNILDNVQISGTAPSADLTGFPTVNPKNVLSAGTSVRDTLYELAARHFLVAFISKATVSPGELVITNAQTTGNILVPNPRLLMSEYGTQILPAKLGAVFFPIPNGGSMEVWPNELETLTPDNDANLANNARYQASQFDYRVYYPFYDLNDFLANSDTQSIIDTLKANYVKRTLRSVRLTFKDVVNEELSATIQRIIYQYTDMGVLTTLISDPPDLRPLRYVDSFTYRRTDTGAWIEFSITSTRTASAAVPEEAPYTGLKIATVTVTYASCGLEHLIGDSVTVVDHIGCVFDLTSGELSGVKGWANKGRGPSLDPAAPAGTLAPCHWCAKDRCCTAAEM